MYALLIHLTCLPWVALAQTAERAGDRTALPTSGSDAVFTGPQARYVVTVEAAGARSAVPADFDGDGDLDIVSVSSNDNTVAWYERLEDGSYSAKKMISRASNGARIVTTGDIDQDNWTDVVVASYYDHTVGWFRNLGGSFGPLRIISRTALSAQGVSVADVDSDGDLDVLAASSGDHTVAWFENLGAGRFCEIKHVVDTNSQGVRTVIAVDLDEDGHQDLAVASKDDNSISWYRNDGLGHFTKNVIDSAATGAYSVVAEDVDRDGHLDLITASNMEGVLAENGEGGKVSLYHNGLGSGGGFTKIPVTADADFDWFVLSVWAGDLDQDGDVDIASASFGLLHPGSISWYENTDGVGLSWTRHQIYRTPGAKTGHYIMGADMDGDGDTDLVAVTNGDNKVQILTASTRCDDGPQSSCCREGQYWDGSTCVSCPRGSFYSNASSSCSPCPTACPRPGLALQPETCHSVPGCADEAAAFARCDCGSDHFLDTTTDVCGECPDGQITVDDRPRAPADYKLAELTFFDGTPFTISDYSWQGFNFSRCQIPQCAPGTFWDRKAHNCLSCAAGTFSAGGGITSCRSCPAGSRCPAGATVPVACQAGNYSEEGATLCSISPAGSVTPRAGLSAPLPCAPGTVAEEAGLAQCEDCPLGKYAEGTGQARCLSCGEGRKYPSLWTSMKRIPNEGSWTWVYTVAAVSRIATDNTSNLGACTCDVNSHVSAEGECVPCEQGLECAGGQLPPQVLRGYMADTRDHLPAVAFTGVEGEYSVFSCQEHSWCPGGPIGTCAEGRKNMGCSECVQGRVALAGGECTQCSGTNYAILASYTFVACVMLGLVFYLVDREKESAPALSMVLIFVSCSLLVSIVQQIGVFGSLDIEWISPIREVVGMLAAVNLSWDMSHFVCVTRISPLVSYLISPMPFLGLLAATGIIHNISVVWHYAGRFQERRPALVSTLGTIILIFLIAHVHLILAPFNCISNPNGLQVVHDYPTVVCYESPQHKYMLAAGAFHCLLPIGYVALICRVVQEFPERMVKADAKFLRSFSFMAFRFKPEAMWYVCVFTGRSLLLPVVPVLPHGEVLQVPLLVASLGLVAWIQCRFFPWRVDMANYLDSFMMMLLMLFLCCLGFMMPSAERENVKGIIAYLCSALLLSCVTVALLTIAWGMGAHICRRSIKTYKYFICHHKKDAAAQARLLKMLLQAVIAGHVMENNKAAGKDNVFIDSDNLQHLDTLLDTVRMNVEHFVIYLTKDTLSRPWCAGELATAVDSKLPITVVVTPDYAPPKRYQLDKLKEFVDLSATNLLQFGITLDMVKVAFVQLVEHKFRTVSMDKELSGNARFDHLVGGICGKSRRTKAPAVADLLPGMVVVSCTSEDDEATAAAIILMRLMSTKLLQICPHGACLLADCQGDTHSTEVFVSHAWAVIVLLSRSSLLSLPTLQFIVEAITGASNIIPVVLPCFTFPTTSYYQEVLPKVWPEHLCSPADVLRDFFLIIGIHLSITSSAEILLAQSHNVLQRLQTPLRTNSLASATSSSCESSSENDGPDFRRRSTGRSRTSSRGGSGDELAADRKRFPRKRTSSMESSSGKELDRRWMSGSDVSLARTSYDEGQERQVSKDKRKPTSESCATMGEQDPDRKTSKSRTKSSIDMGMDRQDPDRRTNKSKSKSSTDLGVDQQDPDRTTSKSRTKSSSDLGEDQQERERKNRSKERSPRGGSKEKQKASQDKEMRDPVEEERQLYSL